jgi:S1-C subfamily serine protease
LIAGKDSISVTKRVVSRVELKEYVHGATQQLAIQIDATINPGNRGGPAIMGDKVAGVAFQILSGPENIEYVVLEFLFVSKRRKKNRLYLNYLSAWLLLYFRTEILSATLL